MNTRKHTHTQIKVTDSGEGGLPHLLPYLDPKKVQFVGVRITVVEDATGDEDAASPGTPEADKKLVVKRGDTVSLRPRFVSFAWFGPEASGFQKAKRANQVPQVFKCMNKTVTRWIAYDKDEISEKIFAEKLRLDVEEDDKLSIDFKNEKLMGRMGLSLAPPAASREEAIKAAAAERAKRKAERERKRKEKEEKERAEAERIAKEKAEAERIAKEKAEAEAKAKAEAEAKAKAEAERIAKEKAEAEAKAKAEAEAKAKAEKERLEKERLEKERLEAERKKKEEEMTRRQNEEVRKKKLAAEQKARAEQEAREKAEKERREKLLSSVKGISELYRQAVEELEIAKTIMKVLKSSVPRGAMHIRVRRMLD